MKIYNVVLWGVMSLLPVSAAMAAEVLLLVDLNTENQVTISATTGASSTTITGSQFTGVYLDMFYSDPGFFVGNRDVTGDLTTALNPADNTPSIVRLGGVGGTGDSDSGLNIWSFSTDSTVGFTENSQAFVGSATWLLDSGQYADMLAGNASGNLYFPADDITDLATATLIGEWQTVSAVPLPAAVWLFGSVLAGMGAIRRKSA